MQSWAFSRACRPGFSIPECAPWRACERTGQHLGRGEVTKQGDQSGSFEGLGLDSLELAEHVDQGQQIEVSAGHEPEDVASVSSSTRATGRPKTYIYTQTDRDKTPILYKRD